MTIHPAAALGAIHLTVADLTRSREFYQRVVGLHGSERGDGTLALGVEDFSALLELSADPAAAPLDRRRTGLFHLAVLLPSRRELALALGRIAETRWPLDGASDHLVSEALYLSDPDGNGIELYRDRPRDQWSRAGAELQMATLPLDRDGLTAELDADPRHPASRAPPETRIGHVHLQVADVGRAEAFYAGALGFEVMVRSYPGALFVSAGGYHHHIGMNSWRSAGAPPPAPGSIGLRSFALTLPSPGELERTLAGVEAAGVPVERVAGAALVRDPSGNALRLTVG